MLSVLVPLIAVVLLLVFMIFVRQLRNMHNSVIERMHGESQFFDVGRERRAILWMIMGMGSLLFVHTLFLSTSNQVGYVISLLLAVLVLFIGIKGLTFSLTIYPDKLLVSSLWFQPKVYTAKQLAGYEQKRVFGGNISYRILFGDKKLKIRSSMLSNDKPLESWLKEHSGVSTS